MSTIMCFFYLNLIVFIINLYAIGSEYGRLVPIFVSLAGMTVTLSLEILNEKRRR